MYTVGLKTALFKKAFDFEPFTRLFLWHFVFDASLFAKVCGFKATRILSKTLLEKFWFWIKAYAGGILDLVQDFLKNIVSEAKPSWEILEQKQDILFAHYGLEARDLSGEHEHYATI